MNPDSDDEGGELAALDRTILPRAVKLFVVASGIAILAALAAPRLLHSPSPWLRHAGALAKGLSAGAVGLAFLGLMLASAAAASLALHRLRARGVSRRAIRNAIVLSLLLLAAGLFFFLPFCLGSLEHGTYDCVPLATRLAGWLKAVTTAPPR